MCGSPKALLLCFFGGFLLLLHFALVEGIGSERLSVILRAHLLLAQSFSQLVLRLHGSPLGVGDTVAFLVEGRVRYAVLVIGGVLQFVIEGLTRTGAQTVDDDSAIGIPIDDDGVVRSVGTVGSGAATVLRSRYLHDLHDRAVRVVDATPDARRVGRREQFPTLSRPAVVPAPASMAARAEGGFDATPARAGTAIHAATTVTARHLTTAPRTRRSMTCSAPRTYR